MAPCAVPDMRVRISKATAECHRGGTQRTTKTSYVHRRKAKMEVVRQHKRCNSYDHWNISVGILFINDLLVMRIEHKIHRKEIKRYLLLSPNGSKNGKR